MRTDVTRDDRKRVLHVGCGLPNPEKLFPEFRSPEWLEVRYDIAEDNQPDILGDMLDMNAVASNSMDAIYSSHNLEHLYTHEVPIALAEFRRVLKPLGFVVLTCPDLEAVARAIIAHGPASTAYESVSGPITPLDILYGHIAAVARGNHYMAHKTGFSAQSLADAFTAAGFNVAESRQGDNFDLWIRAHKPRVWSMAKKQ